MKYGHFSIVRVGGHNVATIDDKGIAAMNGIFAGARQYGNDRDASARYPALRPIFGPPGVRVSGLRHDGVLGKQRWGIGGFFAKLKQWRRIATRYDKLAANFLGFVKLASIMLWLK